MEDPLVTMVTLTNTWRRLRGLGLAKMIRIFRKPRGNRGTGVAAGVPGRSPFLGVWCPMVGMGINHHGLMLGMPAIKLVSQTGDGSKMIQV